MTLGKPINLSLAFVTHLGKAFQQKCKYAQLGAKAEPSDRQGSAQLKCCGWHAALDGAFAQQPGGL